MTDNINAVPELRAFVVPGFEGVTHLILKGRDLSNREHSDDLTAALMVIPTTEPFRPDLGRLLAQAGDRSREGVQVLRELREHNLLFCALPEFGLASGTSAQMQCDSIACNTENPDPVNSSDRSLIRTIMDLGYEANLMTVLLSELLLLHPPAPVPRKPTRGCNPLWGWQDRRPMFRPAGPSLWSSAQISGPVLVSRLEQAAASGGRMHLHVFVFHDAAERLVGCVIPMWMRDGLVELAREVPAGINEMDKVQELREATCVPTPIH
ncbi:hypothetical protein FB45DRAFT_1035375 [Roridomyces roridus]|uniref:Uncharacterized protein n=1 Tax=Roridomyces roridus TaxID=1738132 RepID=A0AAD7FC80_9AGAR|nr:hypothetical protein FB45DRAFT_1035375 [Roridomyces roridus]